MKREEMQTKVEKRDPLSALEKEESTNGKTRNEMQNREESCNFSNNFNFSFCFEIVTLTERRF